MTHQDTLIIVQARMESTRFPEKVFAPLFGQPMILHLLDRLRYVKHPHTIAIAIPDTPLSVSHLSPVLSRHGHRVWMVEGIDPDDVLSRYESIAEYVRCDYIVRITGDCPCIDPFVVDAAIELIHAGVDYVSLRPEWPEGIDVEVMTKEALLRAAREATKPSDREHVTPYIWSSTDFSALFLPCPLDMSRERWSVDTPEDLRIVECVFQELYGKSNTPFGWREIFAVLQSRQWATSYRDARDSGSLLRNEAYVKQVVEETGEDYNKEKRWGWEDVGPKY